jgi:hypothetical protein
MMTGFGMPRGSGTASLVAACVAAFLPSSGYADLTAWQSMQLNACTPVYAIQKRGCALEKVFFCSVSGEDFLLYREIEEGLKVSTEVTDIQGVTVVYWNSQGDFDMIGLAEIRDPHSVTELLETGRDEFDHTGLVHAEPFIDPIPLDVTGEMRLTDETIVLGHTVFTKLVYEYWFQINAAEMHWVGDQYLDRETHAIIAGSGTSSVGGFESTETAVPVEIIYPDDPAFESDQPQYDCKAISSIAAPNSLSAKG